MPVAMSGVVMAALRILLSVIWTTGVVSTIAIFKFAGANTSSMRVQYCRGICWLFGMDIVVHGQVSKDRPLLIASNHVSYLDILAFGAVTELEFVSKADVADWPVIGAMARIGDTVFIERLRTRTAHARNGIAERLAAKRRLMLFPEATCGDGNRLLPFKSALFTVAEPLSGDPAVTVQPAAIAYTRLNGMPLGFGWRSFFAWYGDMTLASHLWRFLQLGQTTVEIIFQDPIRENGPNPGQADRKALSVKVEKASRAGFNSLLSGRIAL